MLFIARSIFFVLLMSHPSLQTAEAPPKPQEAEIPLSIKTKYDEEKSKFQRYDLDHPEKFLATVRKQLKKDQDPIEYLKKLRYFLSRILIQAIFAQDVANTNYAALHFTKITKEIDETLEEIGARKIERRKFEIIPENDAQLEEILAHSQILKEDKPYTPEQLETIYSWIIDPKKGKVLNILGKNRKLIHEGVLTRQLKEKFDDQLGKLLEPIFSSSFERIGNDPTIIKDNELYFSRIVLNYLSYSVKLEKYQKRLKTDFIPPLIRHDLDQENKNISDLYASTYQWYQKLYQLMYQELINTLKEVSGKYPDQKVSLLANLTPLPENAVKGNALPKMFPKELPNFIPPMHAIALPSLDKELAQAQKAWEGAQKENEKHEAIQIEETTRLTPRKIRESTRDGSYMLEGDETPTRITIHNPRNKTVEVIFKTDRPNQISNLRPINYTPWVKIWFENPEKALIEQGYTEFGNPKFEYPENRWKAIARHAFSPLIDEFIRTWGTESEIRSRRVKGKKDILITMPGVITHTDGKKLSQTGVYTYIIDSSNGQWYHRMFTPEDSKQLIEDLVEKGYFSPEMTGYYDVFFPPLGS